MDFTAILQKIVKIGAGSIQALPISSKWGEVDSESDLEYYETADEIFS